MKPCKHASEMQGCRICWLFSNRQDYRELWGGNPNEIINAIEDTFLKERKKSIDKIKQRIKIPCINLGDILENSPLCGCGPRHSCKVHGECVRYGNSSQWKSCSRCPDYIDQESKNDSM